MIPWRPPNRRTLVRLQITPLSKRNPGRPWIQYFRIRPTLRLLRAPSPLQVPTRLRPPTRYPAPRPTYLGHKVTVRPQQLRRRRRQQLQPRPSLYIPGSINMPRVAWIPTTNNTRMRISLSMPNNTNNMGMPCISLCLSSIFLSSLCNCK